MKPRHTILRLPAVRQRTGLSKPYIYLLIRQGKFPKPIPLTDTFNGAGYPTAVGWIEAQVDQWINERIASAA